jgi:hypothetical protein
VADWGVDAAVAPGHGFGRAYYKGDPCPPGRNTIASATVPWPGAPILWQVKLLNASVTSGSALLLAGVGLKNWGGIALPFDLDPVLGTSGCTLYTDMVLALAGTVAAGAASLDLGTVPVDPALAGATLTGQWLVPDAGLPGGLGASNLARGTLGVPPPFATLYNYLANTSPGATRAEFLSDTAPVLFLEVR